MEEDPASSAILRIAYILTNINLSKAFLGYQKIQLSIEFVLVVH